MFYINLYKKYFLENFLLFLQFIILYYIFIIEYSSTFLTLNKREIFAIYLHFSCLIYLIFSIKREIYINQIFVRKIVSELDDTR